MKKFKNIIVMIADGKPDSQNDIIYIRDVKIPKNKVPVTLNFDATKLLGEAELRIEGNQVVADLELTEDGFDKLIPCIQGTVDRVGNKGCSISGIGLAEKNADFRINKLGASGVVVHEKQNNHTRVQAIMFAIIEFKTLKGVGVDWFANCLMHVEDRVGNNDVSIFEMQDALERLRIEGKI